VWPLAIAPFEIVLASLNPSDETTRREADSLYEALRGAGLDVFYDDRDERPGVKFKDADLVGFPIRVNVGGRALKEGKVEIVKRRDKSTISVETAGALEAVKVMRAELAGG
jgi:prolyl-tRNA synthetase